MPVYGTGELSCTADCCRNFAAGPHQPRDKTVIESTRLQVGKKTETRTLNTSRYKDFTWIHLSVTRKSFLFPLLGLLSQGGSEFH